MYNISSDSWTWLSGRNVANTAGVYGRYAITNYYPSSRHAQDMIFHPGMNCLFLYGGYGYVSSTITSLFTLGRGWNISLSLDYLQDLWMYEIGKNWTLLSSASYLAQFGTKGVPSVNNYPGARSGHSMVFQSSLNSFFLFGGYGEALGPLGVY